MSIEKVKEARSILDECVDTLRSKSCAGVDDFMFIKWAIVKDILLKLQKASFLLENQENVTSTNV